MKPTLYVMVGIPGSGKSSFAKKNFTNCKYVSRDEIRFSMLKENDVYFAKENQVFSTFIRTIKENLQAGNNVIADATHISGGSRRKLISNIGKIDYNLVFVVMNTDYKTCLARNDLRDELTKVPHSAMARMYSQFTYPNKEDFENCKEVVIIND